VGRLDIGEAQQEVGMPAAAIIFAVGDRLESDLLLQRDDLADRLLLDLAQFVVANLAGRLPFARADQVIRPDQAADMVGAEGSVRCLVQGLLLC
jgi:hypothetical protein